MKTYTTDQLAMYYGKTVKCEFQFQDLTVGHYEFEEQEMVIDLYFLNCHDEGRIRNVDLTGLEPNKFNEDG